MAAEPWPDYLVQSFKKAEPLECANSVYHGDCEGVYYGPYTRLLYYLFALDGPFEISPQFHIPPDPRDRTDEVIPFIVDFKRHPVLLIDVRCPTDFELHSKREQAADQMCVYFGNVHDNVVTPRLPAISAFGTRLCFYEYNPADSTIFPPPITPDPVVLNDLAPAERWNCDLLNPDGTARLRQLVQDIRKTCQALDL